jgi:hypothetical protein
MSETVLKDGSPMAKTFFGTNQLSLQVSQILTTQVLELAALEQVPHLFLWIQREEHSQASVPDGRVCPSDWRETG